MKIAIPPEPQRVLGKFYNLTGNARGALRQDLESWYGKPLSNEEIGELDLIEALPGRTATIGVMHAVPQGGRRGRRSPA